MLRAKKEIRMWANEAGMPVFLEGVNWSDLGYREREYGERVHFRQDQHEPCLVCGAYGGVWVENESSHEIHKAKCR